MTLADWTILGVCLLFFVVAVWAIVGTVRRRGHEDADDQS